MFQKIGFDYQQLLTPLKRQMLKYFSYRLVYCLAMVCLCISCAPKQTPDKSQTIISMQLIDRHGFAETLSSKERLNRFQSTDFNAPQPYQKVLRVYGRNLAGESFSKITSYHDNGYLWQYLEAVNGRAHGVYREWYPNGRLHVEAYLIEGVADIHDLAQASWIFEGMSSVWDDQGNLLAQIPYEKGLLHGDSLYYYSDGKLQKVIPYVKGLIHGQVQGFDKAGRCLEDIPYFNDERHGKAFAFFFEGNRLSEEEYQWGRLVNASYYNEKGEIVASIKEGEGRKAEFKEGILYSLMTYHEGMPDGELQIFHPNGVLFRSCMYKEGKKEGEEWEYYPAQKGESLRPKICLDWHEDKIQGQVRTWYPTGQIESQREITNNKKQGLCFAWYKNGDLMLVEEYEFDRLMKGSYYRKGDKKLISRIEDGNGLATLYSADGVLLNKITYEKGRPSSPRE